MKKIFLIAAASLSLAACDQNNDNQISSKVETAISASIGERVSSRTQGNSWVAGDRIGITAYAGEIVLPHVNMEYTTADGGSKFEGNPIYYYNGMVLKAYYPFTGTEGTAPGAGGVIPVDTRAHNQLPDTQYKIDYLWDSRTGMTGSNPNVSFTFSHVMSKLTFIFKETSETKVSDIEGYEVIGLKLDGGFDTRAGVCSASNDAAPDSVMFKLQRGTLEDGAEAAPFLLIPQAYEEGQVKLRLYLNELGDAEYMQKYTCVLKFDNNELKPGHNYKFTIHISKAGLKVGTMSIEEWAEDEPVTDVATIDGTPFDE